MLKHRINYILQGETWKTEFEDIPCLDGGYLNFNNLIHKEEELLLGDTGMTRKAVLNALELGKIHGISLTGEQVYFLKSLI